MNAIYRMTCKSEMKTKRILLLGLGNILKSDDGAGIYVISELRKISDRLPPWVQVEDGGTQGFDLVSVMAPFKRILIIDAIITDEEPGSIYHFSSWDAPQGNDMLSLHDMGIMNVIRTMQLLGYDPVIDFIGINARDVTTIQIGLTHPVEQAIPAVLNMIFEILEEFERGGF